MGHGLASRFPSAMDGARISSRAGTGTMERGEAVATLTLALAWNGTRGMSAGSVERKGAGGFREIGR